MEFPETDRGDIGVGMWFSQRDATTRVDSFEKLAYEMSGYMFFTTMSTSVTLDDDL